MFLFMRFLGPLSGSQCRYIHKRGGRCGAVGRSAWAGSLGGLQLSLCSGGRPVYCIRSRVVSVKHSVPVSTSRSNLSLLGAIVRLLREEPRTRLPALGDRAATDDVTTY